MTYFKTHSSTKPLIIVSVFIALLALIIQSVYAEGNQCDIESVRKNIHGYPHNTLSEPLTIDEVEKTPMIEVKIKGEKKNLPFGHLNGIWENMKSLMKPGDCLLYFDSHGDYPGTDILFQMKRYLLVRNRIIIKHIQTD